MTIVYVVHVFDILSKYFNDNCICSERNSM